MGKPQRKEVREVTRNQQRLRRIQMEKEKNKESIVCLKPSKHSSGESARSSVLIRQAKTRNDSWTWQRRGLC